MHRRAFKQLPVFCARRLLDNYMEEVRQPNYNHTVAMHYITLSNQAREKAIQLISEGLDD
jgi:hypothetical protein